MTTNQIPNPIQDGISPATIAQEIHRVAQRHGVEVKMEIADVVGRTMLLLAPASQNQPNRRQDEIWIGIGENAGNHPIEFIIDSNRNDLVKIFDWMEMQAAAAKLKQ
jgi:hypothetical protein